VRGLFSRSIYRVSFRKMDKGGKIIEENFRPSEIASGTFSDHLWFSNDMPVRHLTSFSQTCLRNHLSDINLSHLMKIAIESSDILLDSDLKGIIGLWNSKSRTAV